MLVHEKIASILGRGYRIKEGTQEDTPDLLGEVNYAKQNIYIKENWGTQIPPWKIKWFEVHKLFGWVE